TGVYRSNTPQLQSRTGIGIRGSRSTHRQTGYLSINHLNGIVKSSGDEVLRIDANYRTGKLFTPYRTVSHHDDFVERPGILSQTDIQTLLDGGECNFTGYIAHKGKSECLGAVRNSQFEVPVGVTDGSGLGVLDHDIDPGQPLALLIGDLSFDGAIQ